MKGLAVPTHRHRMTLIARRVWEQGLAVGAAQVDDPDRAGLAATVSAVPATGPGSDAQSSRRSAAGGNRLAPDRPPGQRRRHRGDSTAASTRRNVDAHGAAPHTPSACGAVVAHCAIANNEPAPAITACTACSNTDCRP